ncbi:MAG: dihydrolipoyl dehydrogenase [Dysgonomonas sp.]
MIYDLAIIGGGPAGYTAAERASAKGLKTILFEKNAIGGVCLNEGCIPTKTLLYSAKTLDNIANAAKYGILAKDGIDFDLPKIIARKNKVVRKLTAGIRMKLSAHDVVIVSGNAILQGENPDHSINIICEEVQYAASKVILCTGSETLIPPIKGLSESGYWTSKEALECKELPRTLTIIGGGVIGLEFASFFNSLGVKVSVVEMMPEILGAMDKETSAMLRSEYAKKGIVFHMETRVKEINSEGVVVEKDGDTSVIPTQQVLLSVGRRATIESIGLENLNIEIIKNGVKVNDTMQTSHPKVYACGDITGFSLLAHTAVREAEVAVNNILNIADQMSYKAIPGVVYTNPEIAGVGKTEEELIAKGLKHTVHKLPMAFSGRFVAENEMGVGLCKLIADENNFIIGCHMLGNPASELIVIAGMAIEKGYTIDEFRKIVFPHPTTGEIIHESLFA